jgi:hypothetical protein
MNRSAYLLDVSQPGHLTNLQVCVATHPDLGMANNAGNYALLEDKVVKNPPIVRRVSLTFEYFTSTS